MAFRYQQTFDLTQVAKTISMAPLEIIERAMKQAESVVDTFTPVESGIMVDHLESGIGPIHVGGIWLAQYGNLTGIRLGSSGSDKHYISQFMKWWRATHTGKAKREGHLWPGYDKKLAWFYLSAEQKSILSSMRVAGQFGGPKPPPQYLGAVSGGRRPHPNRPPNVHFLEHMASTLNERLSNMRSLV